MITITKNTRLGNQKITLTNAMLFRDGMVIGEKADQDVDLSGLTELNWKHFSVFNTLKYWIDRTDNLANYTSRSFSVITVEGDGNARLFQTS